MPKKLDLNLELPIYRQHPDSGDCVPFSLKAVAEYYGRKFSKEESREICGTFKKSGSYPSFYIPNAKKMGLKFVNVSYTYKDIKKSLSQNHPVSVVYRFNTGRNEYSHFALITGIRKESGGRAMVTITDTYFGKFEMPFESLHSLMKVVARARNENISCKKIINLE